MEKPKRLADIRIPSSADQLHGLREEVKKVLEKQGCEQDIINNVVLGVNEACMNVIQHAYGEGHSGEIILEILDVQGELVFRLTDFADTVDKSCIKPRDLDDIRPGGLGVHIINEVMDKIEYLDPPNGVGNVLEMKKNIKPS
jgi:sigma-B regulation protein RsbU (phosphoserine phosphatase)